MDRMIILVARVFFSLILGIFMVTALFYEVNILRDYRAEHKIQRVAVSDLSSNVQLAVASKIDENTSSIGGEIVGADARPILIKKYLERYNSPLVPYSNLIFEVSQTYNFPYYWIVAIAQQESNLCKKVPSESHNCWGYGINSAGTLKFDNYEIAIRSFAEYLKREYFDKGYDTVEKIMEKYCPHSNGSWAFGVNQFIEELTTGNF